MFLEEGETNAEVWRLGSKVKEQSMRGTLRDVAGVSNSS